MTEKNKPKCTRCAQVHEDIRDAAYEKKTIKEGDPDNVTFWLFLCQRCFDEIAPMYKRKVEINIGDAYRFVDRRGAI